MINTKSRTYHFFNDIIDTKFFDPNNIKIDEKSYKNILNHYIAHVKIKDLKFVRVNSVNPLYLIFNKMNGYFEKINGNEYLTLFPRNEHKEINNMTDYEVKPEIE